MSKTNRRGFLKFLGVGAAGAGVVAAAGPAQARPETPKPAGPRPPSCKGDCGRLVLDQETGMFMEKKCDECMTGVAPSPYPVGTTGWAREQIVAGHRVRQRCWKDGAGCEMPQQMVAHFGQYYEKGIDKFQGMPVFMDLMVGSDWEIVP